MNKYEFQRIFFFRFSTMRLNRHVSIPKKKKSDKIYHNMSLYPCPVVELLKVYVWEFLCNC